MLEPCRDAGLVDEHRDEVLAPRERGEHVLDDDRTVEATLQRLGVEHLGHAAGRDPIAEEVAPELGSWLGKRGVVAGHCADTVHQRYLAI